MPKEGDYIEPGEVVKARVFKEDQGDSCLWHLDGIDGQGGFTEAIWDFMSWGTAMTAVPDFLAEMEGLTTSAQARVQSRRRTGGRLDPSRFVFNHGGSAR